MRASLWACARVLPFPARERRALRIAVGSDHAGVDLKTELVRWLQCAEGGAHAVADVGPVDATASVDYPEYAQRVSAAVAGGEAELGLLVCGTGVGMSMAANKSSSAIRAAVVSDRFSARATRQHNDCNVLCLGQRTLEIVAQDAETRRDELARGIVSAWLGETFEGGRHEQRVRAMERPMRELEQLVSVSASAVSAQHPSEEQ
eukprot:g3779.t1